MRGGSLFRQASLLAVLWLMNYQGVTKFTEAKTLSNVDGDFRNDFAPNFIEHPTSRNIKEGRPLVLVCAAKGEPKPRIRWKKNGRTINADTRIKIKLNRNGTRSRLKIKKAMPGDSGDYHCVAKNGIRPTSSIKARVEIKRKIGPQPIGGACKPYHGSVCSKFIPGDDRIFIALNNSQQQNEERILLAASILRDYTHSNCKDSLVKFLCFHLFPRCHGGKHPKPRYLCKDDCEVLQAATCSREFHLLERRLGTSAHRTIPDCSSLSDRGNCLSIVNKTIPRRECHHESGDVPEVEIKPFDKNYPMCRDVTSSSSSKLLNGRKSVKFQNKNILPLVRYVKSKILSGQIVMLSKSGEESTFCFTASLPLTSLVRGWNGFHKTSLPPNLRRPNNITVPGLIVSTQNSSISEVLVPLGSAEKYKVHEKVVLKNVKFYYREQSGQGSFIAKGEYNLCGTIFKTTVEKLLDGTIKIKGFSDLPIDLSKIETVFVSVSPPNWLVDAIKRTELLVLRLMKPVMEAYVTSDLVVKFSGETYFGPTTLPVYVEFFGGKLQGQDLLLAGITSPRLTINDALGMLIDFTIPYLDHLNNSKPNGSTVGITLSANTLNLLKTPYGGFNEEPLHQAFTGAVPFGLSLVTSGSLPVASQSSSQLMKLFQAVIGRESEFTVKATADWKDIKLNWRFHNVSKKAVSPFDRVEMTLKLEGSHYPVFPSTPLMAIVDGAFYSDDRSFKRLPFTGQLIYQDHNSMIEGEFETQGAWNKAFGIDFLTAKKLKLRALFSTNQSQKSKITGKADLQMGLNCHATGDDNGIDSIKRDCVSGNIFVGFSDTSAEHFFYGTLTPVSLQKLLEICNINHKLPGAMSTIGFPEGFQISFARKVHDLRKFGGPVLQPGFLLKGKISVLGIETNGVISLLPKEFLVNAKVTSDKAPEMIDDVTSMFLYDADKDHNSKLFLKARMDPVPFVKARIDGYARLFGIFEEVRMLATRDAFQIYLTTDSDKSFKISVQITTNYSLGRNHTQLSANVIFENGLSKLTRAASKQVVTLLEQEMSQIKSAKGAVQRLRRKCAKTIKQDCSICNKDKLCASSLSQCAIDTGAKMVLNASRAKYDSKRANATKTDNCQRLVMARCLATDTTCFNACRFLSSNTNKTCAGYQADAASQRKRERRLRWVKRAEQFMNSDLFQIHAISFKTNVSSTNLQHLSMDTSLEVTIFGQREKINGLRIDFNDFVNLSSEIAKYAWEWYEKAQPKPRHPDNRPRSPA